MRKREMKALIDQFNKRVWQVWQEDLVLVRRGTIFNVPKVSSFIASDVDAAIDRIHILSVCRKEPQKEPKDKFDKMKSLDPVQVETANQE